MSAAGAGANAAPRGRWRCRRDAGGRHVGPADDAVGEERPADGVHLALRVPVVGDEDARDAVGGATIRSRV